MCGSIVLLVIWFIDLAEDSPSPAPVQANAGVRLEGLADATGIEFSCLFLCSVGCSAPVRRFPRLAILIAWLGRDPAQPRSVSHLLTNSKILVSLLPVAETSATARPREPRVLLHHFFLLLLAARPRARRVVARHACSSAPALRITQLRP
ncbi:hypothetical protein B0T24DRAFT_218619 [Lasiosphaeria ovina]|uniref:Secreted protein n=1 Tax=Lasiosphaeria ovina TaxID=92902 RepID=A0AAE0NAM2_9PEZI|nr:hypothetical protein B0T24DRAFT_218619 [Lasiosphaeria ovina]